MRTAPILLLFFSGIVPTLGCGDSGAASFRVGDVAIRIPEGASVSDIGKQGQSKQSSFLIANDAAHQRGERGIGRVIVTPFPIYWLPDRTLAEYMIAVREEGFDIEHYEVETMEHSVTKVTLLKRDLENENILATIILYKTDSLVEFIAPHPGTNKPTPFQQLIFDSITVRRQR